MSLHTIGFIRISPINAGSIGELLVYFRALERRPLSAELLAQSFGPTSQHARNIVGYFLKGLDTLAFSETNQYAEWTRIFGIVYGVNETRGTKYIGELRSRYKIEDNATLKAAFFAIHTYFALLMKLLAAEILSLQGGSLVSSFLASVDGLLPEQVRQRFEGLESGEFFSGLGVRNFLEATFSAGMLIYRIVGFGKKYIRYVGSLLDLNRLPEY